eukprot:gene2271-1414_t
MEKYIYYGLRGGALLQLRSASRQSPSLSELCTCTYAEKTSLAPFPPLHSLSLYYLISSSLAVSVEWIGIHHHYHYYYYYYYYEETLLALQLVPSLEPKWWTPTHADITAALRLLIHFSSTKAKEYINLSFVVVVVFYFIYIISAVFFIALHCQAEKNQGASKRSLLFLAPHFNSEFVVRLSCWLCYVLFFFIIIIILAIYCWAVALSLAVSTTSAGAACRMLEGHLIRAAASLGSAAPAAHRRHSSTCCRHQRRWTLTLLLLLLSFMACHSSIYSQPWWQVRAAVTRVKEKDERRNGVRTAGAARRFPIPKVRNPYWSPLTGPKGAAEAAGRSAIPTNPQQDAAHVEQNAALAQLRLRLEYWLKEEVHMLYSVFAAIPGVQDDDSVRGVMAEAEEIASLLGSNPWSAEQEDWALALIQTATLVCRLRFLRCVASPSSPRAAVAAAQQEAYPYHIDSIELERYCGPLHLSLLPPTLRKFHLRHSVILGSPLRVGELPAKVESFASVDTVWAATLRGGGDMAHSLSGTPSALPTLYQCNEEEVELTPASHVVFVSPPSSTERRLFPTPDAVIQLKGQQLQLITSDGEWKASSRAAGKPDEGVEQPNISSALRSIRCYGRHFSRVTLQRPTSSSGTGTGLGDAAAASTSSVCAAGEAEGKACGERWESFPNLTTLDLRFDPLRGGPRVQTASTTTTTRSSCLPTRVSEEEGRDPSLKSSAGTSPAGDDSASLSPPSVRAKAMRAARIRQAYERDHCVPTLPARLPPGLTHLVLDSIYLGDGDGNSEEEKEGTVQRLLRQCPALISLRILHAGVPFTLATILTALPLYGSSLQELELSGNVYDAAHEKLLPLPWDPPPEPAVKGSAAMGPSRWMMPNTTHLPLEVLLLVDDEITDAAIPILYCWNGIKELDLTGNRVQAFNFSALPETVIVLSLRENRLNARFDAAALPAQLEALDISHNTWYGTLEMSDVPRGMTNLDVSENKLSGEVAFAAIPEAMQELDLHGNHFEGIPQLTNLPLGLRSVWIYENNWTCTSENDKFVSLSARSPDALTISEAYLETKNNNQKNKKGEGSHLLWHVPMGHNNMIYNMLNEVRTLLHLLYFLFPPPPCLNKLISLKFSHTHQQKKSSQPKFLYIYIFVQFIDISSCGLSLWFVFGELVDLLLATTDKRTLSCSLLSH